MTLSSVIYKIIDIFYWDLKQNGFFKNEVESKIFIVNNNPLTLVINLFEIKHKKKRIIKNNFNFYNSVDNLINNFIKIGLLDKNVKSIVKANNMGKWISVKLINNCKDCFQSSKIKTLKRRYRKKKRRKSLKNKNK